MTATSGRADGEHDGIQVVAAGGQHGEINIAEVGSLECVMPRPSDMNKALGRGATWTAMSIADRVGDPASR